VAKRYSICIYMFLVAALFYLELNWEALWDLKN
jgi:hypothetical protein